MPSDCFGTKHVTQNENPSKRQQYLYLCRNCRHELINEVGRCKNWEERMVISLIYYGFSLRTTAALMFVNCSTISRWLKAFVDFHSQMPALKEDVIIGLEEVQDFAEFKRNSGDFGEPIVKRIDKFLNASSHSLPPVILENCLWQ